MYPSPLEQVDSEPSFLSPFSTMAEVDGIPTAPLDLSDRGWPLPSYVADPPLKVILPIANHKPPDCMTKACRRRRSSRRSCRKSSLPINKYPPTTINSSPQQFLHSLFPLSPSNAKVYTAETSKLPPHPSPSTVHIQNFEPCNLKLPPSPSRSTRNVEPAGLEISPSPSTANL